MLFITDHVLAFRMKHKSVLKLYSSSSYFLFDFCPIQETLETICETDRDLVCIGDRYFTPGQPIFSEMIRCLDDSAVFIAVMSKNYCNSDYCKLEIEQARLQGKPIILIFIEEVEEAEIDFGYQGSI